MPGFRMNRRLVSVVAVLAALAGSAGAAAAGEPLRVVAAENVYGDIAAAVGGDRVTVTSIIASPSDDPHLFEASPSTARALAEAALVIYNGADYDAWMTKLLGASHNAARKVIVAADLMKVPAGANPHIWYDPATALAVADATAAALIARDPADATAIGANLAAFRASMKPVMDEVAALKARYDGTVVAATEPVFGYMADAIGLKMQNMAFQQSVMNDTEPTPSQVIAFEKGLSDGTVRVLFYNQQVTDSATERLLGIARAHNVPVVGVTETAPKDKSFAGWMMDELNETGAALARAAGQKS